MPDGYPCVTQDVGQYDTNDRVSFGLPSVRPDQSSFVSVPAPVSPVDSIGKFIGERLVTPQCPGPRLMPGMQLYPVSI